MNSNWLGGIFIYLDARNKAFGGGSMLPPKHVGKSWARKSALRNPLKSGGFWENGGGKSECKRRVWSVCDLERPCPPLPDPSSPSPREPPRHPCRSLLPYDLSAPKIMRGVCGPSPPPHGCIALLGTATRDVSLSDPALPSAFSLQCCPFHCTCRHFKCCNKIKFI